MNKWLLREQLQSFFSEDIGNGDITGELLFLNSNKTKGQLIAKEDGIIAGMIIIQEGYSLLDQTIEVNCFKTDGESVKKGEVICEVIGNTQHLLTGERVILNLIQHMSGIATLTKKCVDTLNSSHTKICDTRKTTPGLRMLEKYAVKIGGGVNHRYGLYDGVMIKDNHIKAIGSIYDAVKLVRENTGHMVKIEVEVETLEQLKEAVEAQPDIIMLDNCSASEVKEMVNLIPEPIISEVSGNITLENIHNYQDIGVDYISMGCLTHSPSGLDISFRLMGEII
ncbi:carboxylating nicotinate-nucleotide diphosphorylase [Gracilibacillus marinus]|jgi:nicotinate-nucleotide pyrophosphorylase (carboxylating)|uniref:nicotinate-nucleotide diphosphorylase (carboxylating) n=1 Tax=Gracilibacillus marinus TaxID=630535 RepID=A0ABV8VXP1_9BACI